MQVLGQGVRSEDTVAERLGQLDDRAALLPVPNDVPLFAVGEPVVASIGAEIALHADDVHRKGVRIDALVLDLDVVDLGEGAVRYLAPKLFFAGNIKGSCVSKCQPLPW